MQWSHLKSNTLYPLCKCSHYTSNTVKKCNFGRGHIRNSEALYNHRSSCGRCGDHNTKVWHTPFTSDVDRISWSPNEFSFPLTCADTDSCQVHFQNSLDHDLFLQVILTNESLQLSKQHLGLKCEEKGYRPKWYDTFSWLHFSVERQAAFCYQCKHVVWGQDILASIKREVASFLKVLLTSNWDLITKVFKKD